MIELGRHIIAEFYGCKKELLKNESLLKEILKGAVKACQATLCGEFSRSFPVNNGVTVLLALSESHISIHTWPEHQYAALDIFTCGENVDPWKAYQYILNIIKPERIQVTEIKRGLIIQRVE